MKYLKQINEYNNEENEIGFLVKKFIDDYISNKLKFTFIGYGESVLYKRSNDFSTPMKDISSKFMPGSGVSSSLNNYEEENDNIKYRYAANIKKGFNIKENNPISKNRKVHEKLLELVEEIKKLESILKKISNYVDIQVNGHSKIYIEFEIVMGFSEKSINFKALKSINQ